MSEPLPEADLRQQNWRRRYATSDLHQSGQAGSLLRDFYVPALLRTVKYDRVAGYFRSSALAAASRGFSALLERDGHIRLIVGCDLAGHDVQAILDGHTERLERHLSDELDALDDQPERVRRGVELLALLVARGNLEIRVAFRRHAGTGEPILQDSTVDGYMHEKWGVMTDAFGNRLSFSGSLNESSAALERNAENIVTTNSWNGPADEQDIEELATKFEHLWVDDHPNFLIRPIPDAIRDKLLRIAEEVLLPPVELDGLPAVPEEEAAGPSPAEWLRWALIKNAPRMAGGETVGIYTAPVQPWPHQESVARRLVATYPYGHLLCDEVGLGKTIETGLAFRALWLSGRACRILVSPPASLVTQWQREMATKFLLPFGIGRSRGSGAEVSYLLPHEHTEERPNLFDRDLLVVSTGLLQRDERMKQLHAARLFDVALVDEAHFARRSNASEGPEAAPDFGKLYRALLHAVKPRARALWLATATPMQMNPVEAFDLADLIGRLGAFSGEQALVQLYHGLLGGVAAGHTPSSEEQGTLRRVAELAEHEDPALWERVSGWILRGDPALEVAYRTWRDADIWPDRHDEQRLLLRLLFALAPLQRVMMRHTRPLLKEYRKHGLLSAKLADRRIRPIPHALRFRPDEQEAYDQLEAYCDDLQREVRANLTGPQRSSLAFFLSLLRQRFASSAAAILATLERRRVRVTETIATLDASGVVRTEDLEDKRPLADPDDWEDEERQLNDQIDATLRGRHRDDLRWEEERLDEMLPAYRTLASRRPTKTNVLLSTMEARRQPAAPGRYRQTVVFTRYTDTLHHLVDVFKGTDPDLRLGTFSGEGGGYWDAARRQWRNLEKNRDLIKQLFLRGEIDLLLCTDAAAEGLNLQTADLLVNYDLPWNPMKVEQRIGRIDRIGQRFDRIEVLNLATVNSVEEVIYGRLWERLSQAAGVVGMQQYSMLPIEEEDFARLARGDIQPDALEQQSLEKLAAHQEQAQQLELPAEDLYLLFNKELRSFAEEDRVVTLDDIQRALVGSPWLQAIGGVVHDAEGAAWLELRGHAAWGGLYTRGALTANQRLYETGLADAELPLRFASYGEPAFDTLCEEMTPPATQPPGIAVVSVNRDVEGTKRERVAVLAMVRRGSVVKPEEVPSVAAADRLDLIAEKPVPEEAVSACRSRLTGQLEKEEREHRQRRAMLDHHRRWGETNRTFLVLLAMGMVRAAQQRPDVDDPDRVNAVMKEVDEMAEEDRGLRFSLDWSRLNAADRMNLLAVPGAAAHADQWVSSPHFRRAARILLKRELAGVRKSHRSDATTTRLLAALGRRLT